MKKPETLAQLQDLSHGVEHQPVHPTDSDAWAGAAKSGPEVTALFCKAAKGNLLKILSSWWDLRCALKCAFYQGAYFSPDQTTNVLGNLFDKNTVSREPESSKLLQTVGQWSSPTSWGAQGSVPAGVPGWKPQLGSSPPTWDQHGYSDPYGSALKLYIRCTQGASVNTEQAEPCSAHALGELLQRGRNQEGKSSLSPLGPRLHLRGIPSFVPMEDN